jgi:hypothetical protein
MRTELILGGGLWLCLIAAAQAQEPIHSEQLPDAPVPARPELAAAPISSRAQPVAQAAPVFHKKVFWTLVGVDAASAVADAQLSRAGLQMYPNTYEQNSWLYGRRPSLGWYYATDVLTDAGGTLLSYGLLHSRRKALRILGWALPIALTGTHADGAIRWAVVIEGGTLGQSRLANGAQSKRPRSHAGMAGVVSEGHSLRYNDDPQCTEGNRAVLLRRNGSGDLNDGTSTSDANLSERERSGAPHSGSRSSVAERRA